MGDETRDPAFLEPLLGIVFDLDGTLVDSQHDFGRMRKTVIELAERHGVVPGHLSVTEPIARLMEAARSEIAQTAGGEGAVYRFEVAANKAVDALELEALPRTRARRGAEGLLKALAEKGFRLGVLTRSSEHFCRSALHQTGLLPYFPTLRTRSSPGPAKPSPEALRLLLDEMGVPFERALYVGDHLLDAECAVRARVRFYAVLPEGIKEAEEESERFTAAGASAVAVDLPGLGRQLGVRVTAPAVAPAHR
jgi:phosphoglycolate phosphatase